ncbi:MAG: helix-turn-helix domain-containing protein, partial [Balneolaceae bacterium]
QWHSEGQAPYITFSPKKDHDDALILRLQEWLQTHFMEPDPLEEMIERSGRARRTLERRFKKATDLTPLKYVQNLRISEARRKLERTNLPVEKIGFEVGYENTAFFRRLFKRITRLTPSAYRRKFQILKNI